MFTIKDLGWRGGEVNFYLYGRSKTSILPSLKSLADFGTPFEIK